jgi:hypothetical protein
MSKAILSLRSLPLRKCWLIVPYLLLCYCSEPVIKDNLPQEKKSAPKYGIIKKPVSSFNDTLIINAQAALFYNPDSIQMGKIKQVNEKIIFETIIHDCYYQMRNAHDVIKKYWPQLRIIESSKARYLLFVKKDKSKIRIDLNEKNDICGIFLFDGEKDPVLIDMPNVNTALGFYFSKN